MDRTIHVTVWVTVSKCLVVQFGKLHKVEVRVLAVGKLQNAVVSRVSLVSVTSNIDEELVVLAPLLRALLDELL